MDYDYYEGAREQTEFEQIEQIPHKIFDFDLGLRSQQKYMQNEHKCFNNTHAILSIN